MNHEQFCYYLWGMLNKTEVTPESLKKIKKQLKKVLYQPVITISNGGYPPHRDLEDDDIENTVGFKQNGK